MHYILIILCLMISSASFALEYKSYAPSKDNPNFVFCNIDFVNSGSIPDIGDLMNDITSLRYSTCNRESPRKILLKIDNLYLPSLQNKPEQLLEAYKIEVSEKIEVTAQSRKGILYALDNLKKHFTLSKELASGIYYDYPDYEWRGLVGNLSDLPCGDFKNKKSRSSWLECQNKFYESLMEKKINKLGIYSPHYFSEKMGDNEILGKLVAAGKQYGIDVYPVINSKIYGMPSDSRPIDALEGISNKGMYRKQGRRLSDENKNRVIFDEEFDDDQSIRVVDKVKGWATSKSMHLTAATINLKQGTPPSLSSLVINANKRGDKIQVSPQEQYEIGIKARSIDIRSELSIYVEQFDESGKIIVGYTFVPTIWVSQEWKMQWAPLFVSPLAKNIAINITPRIISGVSGKVEIDKIAVLNVAGMLINVLNNDETKPQIYSQSGYEYKNGTDFNIDAPKIKELSGYDLNSLPIASISVPDTSSLKDGEVVEVRFDRVPFMFSSIPMTKMSPSSKYTYKFYSDLANELKMSGARYLHLAFDEHRGGFNRDSRSISQSQTNAQLLSKYVSNLENLINGKNKVCVLKDYCIDGIDAGIQLIVWDDMFSPYHNGNDQKYQLPAGGAPGGTGLQLLDEKDLPSKNILFNSWWYEPGDTRGVINNAGRLYNKYGYKFIGSVWNKKEVLRDWAQHYSPDQMLGFDATIWSADGYNLSSETGCIGWDRNKYEDCIAKENLTRSRLGF